jgi:hypothetical protein
VDPRLDDAGQTTVAPTFGALTASSTAPGRARLSAAPLPQTRSRQSRRRPSRRGTPVIGVSGALDASCGFPVSGVAHSVHHPLRVNRAAGEWTRLLGGLAHTARR